MFRIIIILAFTTMYLASCSQNNDTMIDSSSKNVKSPEEIYVDGKQYFNKENYILAENEFSKLKQLYPLSDEAIQAEILSAFINYLQLDYDGALLKFQRFIQKYPSHKNLDYIYYMIAMSNYEQINSHELDGSFNELAVNSFNQVIKRYPNSEYAKDSRQKIVLVMSNKAAKHMEIARFYLNEKKYTAALNRLKIIVEEFSMTKFTPEALHRMVEAYYEMGMYEESYNTAALLGYNYPESEWYEYSYNLVKQIEDEETFLKKIRNFFDG